MNGGRSSPRIEAKMEYYCFMPGNVKIGKALSEGLSGFEEGMLGEK